LQVDATLAEAGPQAFNVALELGDRHRAWRAADLVETAFSQDDDLHAAQHAAEAWEWAKRLDDLAESPRERIKTDIWLGAHFAAQKDYGQAWSRYSRAVNAALESGLTEPFGGLMVWSLLPTFAPPPERFEECLASIEQLFEA